MGDVRVLRVIARMNVGGPAVQISGLMRGLPDEGFDSRLVTGHVESDEQDYLETQAHDVQAVRIQGLSRSLGPGADFGAFRSLVAQIRDFQPDIIHTHTAKAGVLGRAASKAALSRATLVHTFHGHLLHGYFGPRKTQAVIATERVLATVTRALVAVGPQVRDDLLAAGIGRPGQYHVIPPGLSLKEVPDRAWARLDLGIPEDTYVVSFIGRLTQIKRPDRLADVADLVRRERRDVVFLVAGDGDMAPGLRERIARDSSPVRMLGWRSDIQTVLAASDAVLLTSDNEGTPLSLIQAGFAGLPVVATNVGSVKDVVVGGTTGVLCSREPADLAGALLRLVGDPELAHRMGAAGRANSESRFGVQRLVRDHATLYRSLLGRSAR